MNGPPEKQTIDDWLADYDGKPPSRNQSVDPPFSTAPDTLIGEFRPFDHRTTRLGRLALEFEHVATHLPAVKFFNVKLGRYPARPHGQFTSTPGSEFRRFWLYVFGEPPKRKWCRAHEGLHKLKNFNFTGKAIRRNGANGPFYELVEIICLRDNSALRAPHLDRTNCALGSHPDRTSAVGSSDIGSPNIGTKTIGTKTIGTKTVGTDNTDNTMLQIAKSGTEVRSEGAASRCAAEVLSEGAVSRCGHLVPNNPVTHEPTNIEADGNNTEAALLAALEQACQGLTLTAKRLRIEVDDEADIPELISNPDLARCFAASVAVRTSAA